MAYQDGLDDIEDEIASWGYTVSPRDFTRTLDTQTQTMTGRSMPQSKVGGRGRGITNPHHMATVRMASDISNLNAHSFPMGHMPTTSELLAEPPENEITPMLRRLGLSSRDDDVHSGGTRRIPEVEDQVRLDRKLPVILDAELFRNEPAVAADDVDEGIEEEVETYDPNRSLSEQFSTIPELAARKPEVVPEQPQPIKRRGKKAKTETSADSAVSVSSNIGPAQSKKTKKKKWRKMTGEELVPQAPQRGRYEEVYTIGVDGVNPGYRQLESEWGIVGNGRAQ